MALIHLNFCSKYLAGNTDVNIILPDLPYTGDPKTFYSEDDKYPVIWLLHGTYGDYTDWLRKANTELYATEKKVAVVMFSALNTNYINWDNFAMGHREYSYLIDELMPMVHAWFPVSRKREDNFIAGLSMGGRGTCVYAFSRPDLFAGAYVMSSAPNELKEPDPASQFSIREQNLIDAFGGMDHYKASILNVWDRAKECVEKKADLPVMYFACGDKDPIAYKNFKIFEKLADEIGFPAKFFDIPGYSHEWRFWDLCLQDALERFFPEEGKTPVFDK